MVIEINLPSKCMMLSGCKCKGPLHLLMKISREMILSYTEVCNPSCIASQGRWLTATARSLQAKHCISFCKFPQYCSGEIGFRQCGYGTATGVGLEVEVWILRKSFPMGRSRHISRSKDPILEYDDGAPAARPAVRVAHPEPFLPQAAVRR